MKTVAFHTIGCKLKWYGAAELLTDPRCWGAFSRRSRQIAVQRFGQQKIVDRYEQYFLEVLGRRPA